MLIVKPEITEAFAHVGLVIQEILILKDVDQVRTFGIDLVYIGNIHIRGVWGSSNQITKHERQ